MAKVVRGDKFAEFLIRRTEHLEEDIIRQITPVDGWIGHVQTGRFPVEDGTSHTYDELSDVYPDMGGAWNALSTGSCVGTPCDPDEKVIGMGSTRRSYALTTKSYRTQLYCWDQIMSADRATAEFANLVRNLGNASSFITSERMRMDAWEGADTIYALNIAANGKPQATTFTKTSTDTAITYTFTVLPNAQLHIKPLMQQIVPLRLEGAMGAFPDIAGMHELVTDVETAWNLREGNSDIQDAYRTQDFAEGGMWWKYGVTSTVGNFGIRVDPTPPRFVQTGSDLVRVFPYENVAATTGIKRQVNTDYIDAPYQIDMIWHRMAMKMLVRDGRQINPNMPFAVRDFGGKWMFAMDNLGADETGRPIDNRRRNKGMFLADFVYATKYERPTWVVPFLSRREQIFATPSYPQGTVPEYSAPDYSSSNTDCAETFDYSFDLGATSGITIVSVRCNDVPITGVAAGPHASAAATAVALTAGAPQLGTWAGSGQTVTLTDSYCGDVDLAVTV